MSSSQIHIKVQRLLNKLGAPTLNKEVYLKVQGLMDILGQTMFDLVADLLKLVAKSPQFPHHQISCFIDAYEQLYCYEREMNLAPRFSYAT